ncbi:MAG: S41 family peptidase [Planctomycetes bacterium]|nr:S41 family peptidase [Planctomycetota bacterium]
MKQRSRRTRILVPAILAAFTVTGGFVATGAQAGSRTADASKGRTDRLVERWANEVWDAAKNGNMTLVERHLESIPSTPDSAKSAERLRSALGQLRENRAQANSARTEQREKALEEMREEQTADNPAKALRKAVEAQTFTEDFDQAFGDREIMDLIDWAEDRVPAVERKRDWLDAQELLYLLRTFYEDTDRRSEFDRYNDRLEHVNRRVGLLARYVPRRLHEMRNDRAIRMGEEPFGEFNPGTAVDWHERLEDIEHHMLKAGLRTAAGEHIESAGWRPLLEGGLEALRLIATTPALAETFPQLSNAAAVGEWTAHIEEKLAWLKRTPAHHLDHWTMNELLDELMGWNLETVKLPMEVVLREFGDGALNRLDTYSEIIWPDKLRRFQQATAGNFVGVGILIRHNDKREIMVVNPLEGTPAYFQGVKPNDLITQVDGDSTVGWSLNDAVDRITGPKGTVVNLSVTREGVDDLVPIAIERDVIKIRSVKGWLKKDLNDGGDPIWDWYADPVSRIAYIRLTQFTEDSFSDLRRAWREIREEGRPNGLILDLRHNPGGLLTAAVQISNLFVPEGTIVTGEDKSGNRAWSQDARRHYAEFAAAGVPTVVLINRGSASASEIVAGCLQAHGAAVIVGERSFGKGSVQTIHHIARNGRLKLTTQYYRLPSPDGVTPGRLVHKRTGADVWGVDPDVEVPMSVKQVSDAINLRQAAEIIPLDDAGELNPDDPERPDVTELLTEGIDPQLETALIILNAQALGHDEQKHARHNRRGM